MTTQQLSCTHGRLTGKPYPVGDKPPGPWTRTHNLWQEGDRTTCFDCGMPMILRGWEPMKPKG